MVQETSVFDTFEHLSCLVTGAITLFPTRLGIEPRLPAWVEYALITESHSLTNLTRGITLAVEEPSIYVRRTTQVIGKY